MGSMRCPATKEAEVDGLVAGLVADSVERMMTTTIGTMKKTLIVCLMIHTVANLMEAMVEGMAENIEAECAVEEDSVEDSDDYLVRAMEDFLSRMVSTKWMMIMVPKMAMGDSAVGADSWNLWEWKVTLALKVGILQLQRTTLKLTLILAAAQYRHHYATNDRGAGYVGH